MGLAGALVIRGEDEPDYDREFVQFIDEWIRLPDERNGWEGVGHAGHNPSEYKWFTLNGASRSPRRSRWRSARAATRRD